MTSTLLNHWFAVETHRRRFLPQLRHASRARVVGGERKQAAVQRIDALVGEVAIPKEAHVLDARVDVVLEILHVVDSDVAIRCRRRLDLHDADRAGGAALRLVELRFLIALRDRQHPVGAVLFAVRAKVLRHRSVLLDFPRARRILEPLHAAEIALQQHVAEQRARAVLHDEIVDDLLDLRRVLAQCPSDLTVGSQRHLRVNGELVIELRPELGDGAFAHRRGNDAGVHHLQDIFVFEVRIDLLDRNRSAPRRSRAAH